MKVKVITITGESNYGNSLQNYAVIQTLNSLGCEAQTVKTEYEPNFTKLCKKNLKIYTKVALKIKNYHWFKRQMRFKNSATVTSAKPKKSIPKPLRQLSTIAMQLFSAQTKFGISLWASV